jgi:hypothetical protein
VIFFSFFSLLAARQAKKFRAGAVPVTWSLGLLLARQGRWR